MEEPSVVQKGDEVLDLPPGFRFHPTDEEVITCYLTKKVMNSSFNAIAIGAVDLNKCEPWDLPKKAKMGEKEWFFFCQKDRKYPTGTRTNRATESGYWKATGKDKEIFKGKGCLVGMKKTLVFYKGRAPKGEKTNWVMHEFRLEGRFASYHLPRAAKDEWAVCKVFHKNSTGIKKTTVPELLRMNSFADDDLLDYSSLPPLMDSAYVEKYKPDGNELKGTTTLSSAKSLEPAYNYLPNCRTIHPVSVKQENNSNFQMPISSYTTLGASSQANLTNPLGSSFPYHPMSEYRSGYMQADQKNISYAPRPVTAMSSGFWGRDDDTILRSFVANINDISEIKVQQPFSSNQSRVSVSQDTGLSNDINTETSSVVSKQDMTNNNTSFDVDLECPSVGPMSDLDCLWDDNY